jgi:hypothetical protein
MNDEFTTKLQQQKMQKKIRGSMFQDSQMYKPQTGSNSTACELLKHMSLFFSLAHITGAARDPPLHAVASRFLQWPHYCARGLGVNVRSSWYAESSAATEPL